MWVITGLWVATAAATFGFAFWSDRKTKERLAWEAEHPYPQVEPPRVPESYRYVEREELDQAAHKQIETLHEIAFKKPQTTDLDPAFGDLVIAFVEVVEDGKTVQDCFIGRVLWPRNTYVRALVRFSPKHQAHGVSKRDVIDIPREAIASVVHVTAPALPEPAPQA
jgi:hypothetical protein